MPSSTSVSIEERAARAAHEVLRAFAREMGDDTYLRWEHAPDWQRLASLAGVEELVADAALDAEACHGAWMARKLKEGWLWGDRKNPETKTHPSLVAFEDLPDVERAKDEIFVIVVRAALTHFTIGSTTET